VLEREEREAVDDDAEDAENRGPLQRVADDLPARGSASEPASIANTAEMPITKTNVGKTRSVAVRPFHSAWFMKPHDPSPPLLLTMIMKAIVIPRATSSDRSLGASPGRGAVLADAVCVTAALAAYGMADRRHTPNPRQRVGPFVTPVHAALRRS
jgi:hypothetical protein